MSGHDSIHGRRRRKERVCGVKDARDGTLRAKADDDDPSSAGPSAPNVLQDIASALGGLDHVASWLYWERRESSSWSPLDGASNEQRALMLKALERVEKARRKPFPKA